MAETEQEARMPHCFRCDDLDEEMDAAAQALGKMTGTDASLCELPSQVSAVETLLRLKDETIDAEEALVLALDEYLELLGTEYDELAVLAGLRGWKSSRIEAGKAARAKIAKLRS